MAPTALPERALAERVIIVLVEPQHPGNIGATARAMKNMGMHRLTIVRPAPSIDIERARWMAPGAGDVLNAMRICATLEEATADAHQVYATTARHRAGGQPVDTPRDVAARLFDDPNERTIAVLFGREDFGLSKADALRAQSLVRIPTPPYASLNLGQAVLLMGHTFFQEATERGMHSSGRKLDGGSKGTTSLDRKRSSPLASAARLEPIVSDALELLDRVGFTRGVAADKVSATIRSGLQSAALSERHVHSLRGMLARIEYALNHPDVDWKAGRSAKRPKN